MVLEEHAGRLLSLGGVVGTAIGDCGGRPCIRVFVVERSRALLDAIPPELGGYPVVVEETGELEALGRR